MHAESLGRRHREQLPEVGNGLLQAFLELDFRLPPQFVARERDVGPPLPRVVARQRLEFDARRAARLSRSHNDYHIQLRHGVRKPDLTHGTVTQKAANRQTATPVWKNPGTVLITGATGGLGTALARSYASPGRTLVLHGRDPSRLAELSRSCEARGARVVSIAFDLRDAQAAVQELRHVPSVSRSTWPLSMPESPG